MSSIAEQQTAPVLPANRFHLFVEWIDGRLNPVLVKDIRGFLRNWVFLVVFFLAMGAGLLATIFSILLVHTNQASGRELYTIITSGLAFVFVGIIPPMMMQRFTEEIRSRSTELVLISRLTAAHMVRGKIFSTMAASMLFFSAVAPGIMIAYLLGGLSLPFLVVTLGILFLEALGASVLGIVLVAISSRGTSRFSAGLFFLLGFIAFISQARISHEFRSDSLFNEIDFWFVACAVLFNYCLVAHFLYTAATSQLTFSSDNRCTRPRLALAMMFWGFVFSLFETGIALSIISGSMDFWKKLQEALVGIICVAPIGFTVGLLFILNTPDNISERIRKSWPRWPLYAQFFYPGEGRLFSFILLHALVIASFGLMLFDSGWQGRFPLIAFGVALLLLSSFGLATTAYHLFHRWLVRQGRKMPRALFTILFLAFWSLPSPIIMIIYVSVRRGNPPDWPLLLGPISLLTYFVNRPEQRFIELLMVTAPLLAISALYWIPCIVRSFAETVRLSRDARKRYYEEIGNREKGMLKRWLKKAKPTDNQEKVAP